MPAPNVDSAVIHLDIREERLLPEDEEKTLFRLIRAGFSQRRKQLLNPLSAELHKTKTEVSELLQSAGINPLARAEELSLEDYIRLAKMI